MTEKSLTKILFVDDDRDILTIAKYSLESLSDVHVKYLTSGEEAIQEALVFNPDLILIDVMMPKMDGITTLNAMRLIPTLAKIPVVFVTAKVQKEELANYSQLGILDVIIKPFDPLTLAANIKNIWSVFQLKK
jgi:two-component system, OmpR family, response regulator